MQQATSNKEGSNTQVREFKRNITAQQHCSLIFYSSTTGYSAVILRLNCLTRVLLLSKFSVTSFRRLYFNSCKILASGIWIEDKKQLAIRRQSEKIKAIASQACKKKVSVLKKSNIFAELNKVNLYFYRLAHSARRLVSLGAL